MRTAIVGAGAAGLSLALMLDGDVTVFEKANEPGGLCRSNCVDGFTFDTGPHILGGIEHAVDWIIASSGVRFVSGETRNVGWFQGDYVAHPFEDSAVGWAYMAKMWKADPDQLAPAGLGAQQGRQPGGVRWFRYPHEGSYQAITDAWAAQVPDLRLDTPFPGPDGFDRIVWTAPLPAARYNSLGLVTAAYEGEPPPFTAIYLPGDWTPFHRLSFPGAFSPMNCPPGWFSVQGEASIHGDPPELSALAAEMGKTLDSLGIGSGLGNLLEVKVVRHAYPVPVLPSPPRPTHARGVPVILHGRTGAHRYINLDGVVAESMRLASVQNGTEYRPRESPTQ